jgi:uncharacterized cofD-like protein
MWRWLVPGLHIKRHLAVVAVGILAVGAGLALELLVPHWSSVTRAERLQYLAWSWGLGLALIAVGTVQLVRSLARALDLPEESLPVLLRLRQRTARGPKVVALGGGTGMPALLRGLKEYTSNITAIVTMADNGGSSGRLRGSLGMLPPGDVRNCLVALADTEPLMRELFQYRFEQGELSGHSFGNLFLAALQQTTGDFVTALRAASRVLAVRGSVLPATLDAVDLVGELEDGRVVRGESQIGKSDSRIRRVWLEPGDATPLMEAVRAVEEADLVVIGPGSLYTSVIPNLLVAPIADAVRRTRALRVYVANVMTQPGETSGYSAADHLKALEEHAGAHIVDIMIVNSQPVPDAVLARYGEEGAAPVRMSGPPPRRLQVVSEPLLDVDVVVRHNPDRLARAVLRLLLRERPEWARRRPWESLWLEQRLKGEQGGSADELVAFARGEGRT